MYGEKWLQVCSMYGRWEPNGLFNKARSSQSFIGFLSYFHPLFWRSTGTLDKSRCWGFNEVHSCTYTSAKNWKGTLLFVTTCTYPDRLRLYKQSRDKACSINCQSNWIKTTGPRCTDDFMASCEAYLVQVFKKNTACTTMDQLRDYVYHHSKGVSLNMLPPTSNAVQEHIHRAYYATYQMVTLLQPHKPTLLNPIAFGFKKTDELLLPVKGVKPIPEEYTILCNCKKCSNDRCACRKAGLPCISFCKCHSLQGVEENCTMPESVWID